MTTTTGYHLPRRAATYGAVAAGSALAGAGSVWAGAAVYFARRVLTPEPERPDDAVLLAHDAASVTLELSGDTLRPGYYGLWLDGGRGHARVGPVLGIDRRAGSVRRELVGVDGGRLQPGPVRVDPYYWARDPAADLGLGVEHVAVDTELGPAPAWLVPGPDGVGERWAVCVHGRGAQRHEALRALPSLHRAGLTTLVPSYRNDGEAPRGPDGRYSLGLAEWRDLQSALQLAVSRGAREIVLVGWSMGAAIVLQLLDRSPLASHVSRVVLDGPVVDWSAVLAHQGALHSLPAPVTRLAGQLMGSPVARALLGVHEAVDVTQTNWVERAAELSRPMLLIHSRDDAVVPSQPSEALAAARPDLIDFRPWSLAGHCREWNVDPARWEQLVVDYLT